MPPQTEMLGDRAIGREKALSVAGGLEPLQPALPLPGWLVGVLRTIIQIAMLAMFHPGEDLSPGSTIALELVGNDHARDVAQALEQLAEERLCCKVLFSEVLGYCLSLRVAVGRWGYGPQGQSL